MDKKSLVVVGLIVLVVVYFVVTNRSSDTSADLENSTTLKTEEIENKMTFFVTNVNPGTGADYGGLVGADQYCQSLAESVEAEGNWHAYLSAVATTNDEAVNARDRIGNGPWHNAAGVLVASDIEELHGANFINKETALSETGAQINGRGDSPNAHDILTGSLPDGTVSQAEGDTTCSNWTSDNEGSAIVGHHDRQGLDESDSAKSWNSSHGSRGCSLENLNGTGGGGLLYCFAVE